MKLLKLKGDSSINFNKNKRRLSKAEITTAINKDLCPHCNITLNIKPAKPKRVKRAESKRTYYFKFTRTCPECKSNFKKTDDRDDSFCKEKQKQKNRTVIVGEGNICPKCNELMQRRKHEKTPDKWHFTEWDYCSSCNGVKHYDKFKCASWKELENQNDHFRNIN
jgi:uncharacterized protein with PIN domain